MQGYQLAAWTELEWESGYDGGAGSADPPGTCQVLKELCGVQVRATEKKMRLRREERPPGLQRAEQRQGGRGRDDTDHGHEGGVRDGWSPWDQFGHN